ncbi:MAG TPA: rhomboid family intramembrane serine protease [Polyangiaceae bacterium]
MDPEYVLKWVIGAASLFEFCKRWLGFRERGLGWRWFALGLLLLLAADYWLRIPGAAYALALAWCALVAVPSYALVRRQRALHAGQLAQARRWARCFAWLHPLEEPRFTARWIEARALWEAGRVNDAEQLLHALEKHPTFGELARLEGLRCEARWSALLERLEGRSVEHPGTLGIALQAYGETGQLSQMLATYETLERELTSPARPQLEVAAYLGSASAFELALAKLRPLPPEVSAYFRGVLLQAAGDRLAARTPLQEAEAHPGYQRRALARLRRPLDPIESLPAPVRAHARTSEQALHFALARLSAPHRKPWATWSLGALIVLMFLLSVPGDSLDATNLVEMGALLLPQDLAPGAWRVLTAGFLHRGFTHFAVNLMLLLLFGSILERLWGWTAVLACFSCANVGSYWIATWMVTATPDRPEVLLGASAGAYGLLGALVVFDAVSYAFDRSPILLRRMSLLALMMLAQMLFDSFVPIVRTSLHWTGAALGALVACPLALRFWKRRGREAPARESVG